MMRKAATSIPNMATLRATAAKKALADCVLVCNALLFPKVRALLKFVATGPAVDVEDMMLVLKVRDVD